MPTITPNKTTVPINADAWNLTADLFKLAMTSNNPIPVASQTERDGLAALFTAQSMTMPIGTQCIRNDLPMSPTQTWDGTQWNGARAYTLATLTANALYTPRGSGFASPSVYRMGGRVYLRGTYMNIGAISTFTAGTIYPLATLPAGYTTGSNNAIRPPIDWEFSSVAVPHVQGWVQVDGTAVTFSLASTVNSVAAGAAVMSLDCVSWLDV